MGCDESSLYGGGEFRIHVDALMIETIIVPVVIGLILKFPEKYGELKAMIAEFLKLSKDEIFEEAWLDSRLLMVQNRWFRSGKGKGRLE